MLVAEAETFAVNRTLDATGLVGSVTATVDWGDGRITQAAVTPVDTNGPLTVRIDYSFDTNGFFNDPTRRALLQAAADGIVESFTDQLTAISPSGTNTWSAVFQDPSNRNRQVTLPNLNIAANEIVLYAGAQSFPGSQLAEGSFGGFSASGSQAFLDTVSSRGQGTTSGNGANDFGPWGGVITFDTGEDWYFGQNIDGIEPSEIDFVSVAMHEVVHALGFGTSNSWNRLVSGSVFTGARSRALFDGGGNVPLWPDLGHWDNGLTDEGQPTLLDPEIPRGQRVAMTPLDFAGLDDLGWTIANRQVTVTASHVYADDGNFEPEIILSGSNIGERRLSLAANITNVAPTVDVSENLSAIVGQPISIVNVANISDPGFRNSAGGTDETFTFSIDWGDGTSADTGTATIDRVGSATSRTLASFDAGHTYSTTGNRTVRVTVTDDDNGSTTQTFQIQVGEPPALQLSLDRNIFAENEGAGAANLTISRGSADSTNPLTVTLSGVDATEAQVSQTVTILAGQSTVVVPINAVDDNLLDGTQATSVTATASGFIADELGFSITDVEELVATFSRSVVSENAGTNALTLTLRRSNTDGTDALNVIVSGGDASVIDLPMPLTIPAGVQQAGFSLSTIDNETVEGNRELTYTFSASPFTPAIATLTVADDEPPPWQNPLNQYDVNGSETVSAIDALVVLNELNRSGARSLVTGAPSGNNFYDANGDYRISAIDALVVINRLNSTGPGGEGEAEQASLDSMLALDIDWLLDLNDEEA